MRCPDGTAANVRTVWPVDDGPGLHPAPRHHPHAAPEGPARPRECFPPERRPVRRATDRGKEGLEPVPVATRPGPVLARRRAHDVRPRAARISASPSGLDHAARAPHHPEGAARRVDQHRGRQAGRLGVALDHREHAAAGIGVEGRGSWMPGLLQPVRRPLRVAGVDVDGDNREIRAAELGLEPVEGRHLGLAGGAPGRPEIDQQQPALEIGQPGLGAVRTLEPDLGRRPGPAAGPAWRRPRPWRPRRPGPAPDWSRRRGRGAPAVLPGRRPLPYRASPRAASARDARAGREGGAAGASGLPAGMVRARKDRHEQPDVGRPLRERPGGNHGGDQRLHRTSTSVIVRPQDIRRLAGPLSPCSAQTGIVSKRRMRRPSSAGLTQVRARRNPGRAGSRSRVRWRTST